MTYTVTLTRHEIAMIQNALRMGGTRLRTDNPERLIMEGIYKKLLEVTASDNVARAMQDEGDKYGHD